MKLQYILSVPATATAAITLPFGVAQVKMRGSTANAANFYLFVEELGGATSE